ncbi:hypothetical protein [Sphingomonas aerophila]|uniref:Uncharacterized protein n=1 Tax=Sphingomonas aerophila TaxID=1344948 RepID=A0A7W9BES7_9SPHN|nr:hypothetical protein [Sphingomonas aerophila]MBB5715848.1 hypothetical protein [Sphingomonas aerophila]
MTKLFSRADFLAAKLPSVDVLVPELGEGALARIQQLSVQGRISYLERIRRYREAVNAYEDDQDAPVEERKNLQEPEFLDVSLLALVYSIVDENGDLLFTEADFPEMNRWAHAAVERMYSEMINLNEIRRSVPAAVEAEKKG